MSLLSSVSDETRQLCTLQSARVLDSLPQARFEPITRLACRLFNVPIARVVMHDELGREPTAAAEPMSRDDSSLIRAVVRTGARVVADLRKDRLFRRDMASTSSTLRFFAAHPVHASDGASIGMFCIAARERREFSSIDEASLKDLAAIVDRELALISLSTVDELTRLTNRRGLVQVGQHVLALCQRLQQPACVLLVDLDDFKQINDTLGHAAGDVVLRRFGSLLLKVFRTADVIARLGGDEFCVVMGGQSAATVSELLERFGVAFSRSLLAREHPMISWSWGLSVFSQTSDADFAAVLQAADHKMYEAKATKGADAERIQAK